MDSMYLKNYKFSGDRYLYKDELPDDEMSRMLIKRFK